MRFARVANQTISYFATASIGTELRAKMQTLRRDTGQDGISDASGGHVYTRLRLVACAHIRPERPKAKTTPCEACESSTTSRMQPQNLWGADLREPQHPRVADHACHRTTEPTCLRDQGDGEMRGDGSFRTSSRPRLCSVQEGPRDDTISQHSRQRSDPYLSRPGIPRTGLGSHGEEQLDYLYLPHEPIKPAISGASDTRTGGSQSPYHRDPIWNEWDW